MAAAAAAVCMSNTCACQSDKLFDVMHAYEAEAAGGGFAPRQRRRVTVRTSDRPKGVILHETIVLKTQPHRIAHRLYLWPTEMERYI